jgi:cystathionine beta-synthase
MPQYTRKIALEEVFRWELCWSCHKGLLQLKEHFKPEDVVVVLFHDSGTLCRKMFNDDWMRERGFLEEEVTKAEDVIKIILTSFNWLVKNWFPMIERMQI